MRLMQRMELHNFLRRQAREDGGAGKVLAHDEALAVLEVRVERAAAKVGASAGPIQTFLQWLLDNRDAILAFVKEILALFGL